MWGNITEESCDVCDCSSMIASVAQHQSGATFSTIMSAVAASTSAAPRQVASRRLRVATATAASPTAAAYDDKVAAAADTELSFYDCGSPARSCSSMDMDMFSPAASPTIGASTTSNLTAISASASASAQRSFTFDYNSRDSGYNGSTSVLSSFKFAQPTGLAPKQSPPKTNTSTSCFRAFNSCGTDSVDSMDDDYMELLDMEAAMEADDDDCTSSSTNSSSHTAAAATSRPLPTHFSSIISGTIRTQSPVATVASAQRVPLRRCLSLIENNSSISGANKRMPSTPEQMMQLSVSSHSNSSTTPLSTQQQPRAFKRPEAPVFSPTVSKRFKPAPSPGKENDLPLAMAASPLSASQPSPVANVAAASATRHLVRKSISMNDASIMSALARSSTEPDLIGDFSKPYALPLIGGRHRDLKSISAGTMARLLRGDFAATVGSFRVVDCRYPYEFEGGHIEGAENLYTQEAVLRELVHAKRGADGGAARVQADGPKREILVFHCEFSSERGPKLSRFLRNHDRQCNTNVYPALHYPEVYLLHGGYKEFYEANEELCAPMAYRPMLDPAYGQAYKHFRAQTKSWTGAAESKAGASAAGAVQASGAGGSGGPTHRLMKTRSRLVL